jgi:acyl-homoserine-lactone acylase
MSGRVRISVAAAVAAIVIAILVAVALQPTGAGGPGLKATIRTTAYGVPHVTASSYADLGFGAGYAYARQALCEIAGRFVTVRAERSKYFGPDERVPDGPGRASNLDSDFFWRRILDMELVEKELALPPPLGPDEDLRQLMSGYAAGYNEYLAATGVENLPDPRCRGQAWVRPITEKDLYLRAMHWNLYRSGGSIITQIAAAAPPAAASAAAARDVEPGQTVRQVLQEEFERADGSNMIALGADATDNGRGMLFANPHWTWEGPDRWFEMHLTIPGRLDVYGMQTSGLPVIQTGFNEHVAWAGTSSVANRWTIYELKLAAGRPTAYVYDGTVRAMTPRVVRVEARRTDGRIEPREHTFWETHFGPMLQDRNLVWSEGTAYAMRDVAYSFRWLGQQLRLNQARSTKELSDSGRDYMAIGWRNLAAADSSGNVFYGDRTAVPNVSDRQIDACATSRIAREELRQYSRMILLDGSRSACEWGAAPDAPVPGILPASALPELHRKDYVLQSNDTHWLNSLRQPLEGYPAIMGDERTARTLRTRNALRKVENRLNGSDGHPGTRFTLPLLKSITMDNQVFSADLWLQDTVALCRTLPGLGEACGVLAAWDRTENLDSAGALLWRRFVERLGSGGGRQGAMDLYTTTFDPADAIRTPTGLDVRNPRVATALRAAVADLTDSGIPLRASLRDYQYALKGTERIPISGGPEVVGQYNRADARGGWVPGSGYPGLDSGASFIMWMQFTDAGPVGESILTFSQSPNPASPHYADQTKLWSEMKTKPIRFTDRDISADAGVETLIVCTGSEGDRGC